MQEQIRLLKELQTLDQELSEVRQNRGKLDEEQAELASELGRTQGMMDSLVQEIEGLQGEYKELAQALDQEKENVAKAEGRLPAIKTQKEYVAVLKEIDTAKKLNKDLQDRIRDKNAEIEVLNRDSEEKSAQLEEVTSRVEARQGEIAAQLNAFDAELAGKTKAREKLLAGLPTPLAKRYKLLFDRRQGIAVVEARRGACTGCHMHLPPQLFNSLYTTQEIQSCPHCNRLIFVEAPE